MTHTHRFILPGSDTIDPGAVEVMGVCGCGTSKSHKPYWDGRERREHFADGLFPQVTEEMRQERRLNQLGFSLKG